MVKRYLTCKLHSPPSQAITAKTSSNPSGISGPASSSPSPLQKTRSFDSGDTPSRTVTRIALGESLVFSNVGDKVETVRVGECETRDEYEK